MWYKIGQALVCLALVIITALFVVAEGHENNAIAAFDDLGLRVKRQEVIINTMLDYIGKLQEKKILPNGNDLEKK